MEPAAELIRRTPKTSTIMSCTLLHESTPKARKEHRCEYCSQKIIVGETYYRQKSAYDGNMRTFAFHPDCEHERRELDHKRDSEWERDPCEYAEHPPALPSNALDKP